MCTGRQVQENTHTLTHIHMYTCSHTHAHTLTHRLTDFFLKAKEKEVLIFR